MVARGIDLPSKNLEILQLAGYILEKMGIDIPANLDGKNTAVTPQFDM
jgi:hypothetical protein